MENTSLQLPRSRPEALGIPGAAILDFLDEVQAKGIELHSFMLLRRGQVAAEGWWGPYAPELPHMLFSLSKSFTSTAIGLAVHEGLLSLEDKVVTFFPDDLPEEVSPNLAAMNIRHLLMMGTGNDQDTMGAIDRCTDGNWAKAFLAAPVEHTPGTHFVYNTGATYMLSAILQSVTGQTLLQFLQKRLFEPLGIHNPTWESCPRGINTGGFGLSITTEDIAKFGQLFLQRGAWNGSQLIPEAWVEEATSKQISNGDGGESDWAQGYGYQFWRCRHGAYRGDGAFGQFCIVMPEQEAVLAVTSGTNQMQEVMNAVWERLLPAMAGEELQLNEETQDRLQERIRSLQLAPLAYSIQPELESAVSGKNYVLDDNDMNWSRISVRFEADQAVVDLYETGGKHFALPLGRGKWLEGKSDLIMPRETATVSSFTWKSPDTLELSIRFIETPFHITTGIRFEPEDSVVLDHRINVSFGPNEAPPITGRA